MFHTFLFGAFQVTRPLCHIHHTETDWADLQACPVDPRASCSLSASHNNAGIIQTGEVWEPTEGVHPGWGRGRRGDVGGERGGSSGRELRTLFSISLRFSKWAKKQSGVLCHPDTQRLLKSCLSGFSSEVSSQETKRGRGNEWVGKEFNGGLVWGTGSGRMASLDFVKNWASLAASLWPCQIWGEKHRLCSSSSNKKNKKEKSPSQLDSGCGIIKSLIWRCSLSDAWVQQQPVAFFAGL